MQTPAKKPPTSVLQRSLFSLAVSIVLTGALLFLPAGTFAWPAAWWLLGLFLVEIAIALPVLWRLNPEIFAARSGFKPGTKSWDLVIALLAITSIALIPIIAGLDFRFGWSAASLPVLAVGNLAFAAGFALTAWAQAVNKFFEPGVRIQTERGHIVIDTGPYAHTRHPGYVGATLLAIGIALALGSWWALLPSALTIAVLIYRTLREEETLKAELPGYAEYTERVRYRWVPGLW
jgi:protein-S-isoprenylcysteine O-methyltransferase Ste14